LLSGGNLGIGTTAPDVKLQVAGTIRVGDGGESCTGGNFTGGIRYNGGNLQYCDGTAWLTLAGSGSISNALDDVTAAADTNTIANGDHAQIWNWEVTTNDKAAFTFGEAIGSPSTGTGASAILKAATVASSTATPLMVTNLGDA